MTIRPLALALVLLAVPACSDDKPAPYGTPTPPPSAPPSSGASALDASSPKALAESNFAIAKSGDLALLASIADPTDADGDAKAVAGIAQAPADRQASFRKEFAAGKVSGDVKVDGDKAEVPILFGADGTRPETFVMVKRGDRWHLQSF